MKQVRTIFTLLGRPGIIEFQKSELETEPKVIVLPQTIELYTCSTWNFAHSILWNKQQFSIAEINHCKELIRQYYTLIPAEGFTKNSNEFFIRYLERILFAKAYVECRSYRFLPHPCIWLDKNFEKGFAGTKSWYDKIQQGRKIDPEHYRSERIAAELYAEYILTGTADILNKAVKAMSGRNSRILNRLCAAINWNLTIQPLNQTA